MPPLPAKIPTLETVAEGVRDSYVAAKDGTGFILDVEAVDGMKLENVDSLRTALASEREKTKNTEYKHRELESQFKDIDVEDYKRLKAAESSGELKGSKAATAAADAQAQLENLQQKSDRELKEARDALIAERERNDTAFRLGEFHTACQKFKAETGLDPNTDLLWPAIEGKSRVKRGEDDRRYVELIGDDGKVRYSQLPESHGEMGFGEYLSDLAKQPIYQGAFLGTGANGMGSDPNNQGAQRGTPTGRVPSSVSSEDKAGFNQNLEGIANGSVKVAE
jgi:hypothetical protein